MAKNLHNLKTQSTDLQKMKGILNSTELCTFEERPLPTPDIHMPAVWIYACLSPFCVLYFGRQMNSSPMPSKNQKLNVDAQQL